MKTDTLSKLAVVIEKYPEQPFGKIIGAIVDLVSSGDTGDDKLDNIYHLPDDNLNVVLDWMISGNIPEYVRFWVSHLSWIKP